MTAEEPGLDEVRALCKQYVDAAVVISPDRDGLAFLLAELRQMIKDIKDTADYVEDELTKVMEGKTYVVEGLGEIEMHTGASRKAWDKDGVMKMLMFVAARTIINSYGDLVDTESGEAIDPLVICNQVWEALKPSVTPGFKVTGLRAAGIDPDEYAETTWGRKTIVTPPLPG